MTLPEIKIRMSADERGATAGVNRVNNRLKQLDNNLTRTAQRTRGMNTAMAATTRSSNAMRAGIQNAAFQVGDFAVQVGAGTAASRALAQQLPQLLGGLGVFGAVAGAGAAVMVPLAASFMDGANNATEFKDALEGVNPSLGSIRGQISELASLQKAYKDAISGTGSLAAANANAVVSATQREYQAKLSLLDVSQKLLGIEMQERRITLRNLQSQARAAADLARSNARDLSVQTRQSDAQGFAYTGPRTIDDALVNTGFDSEKAEKRRLNIQQIEAELELLSIAANEAGQAMDGVFEQGSEKGGSRSKEPKDVETPVERNLKRITALTKGQLSERLGAWSSYFSNLEGLVGSNNAKMLAVTKATGAAQAAVNAWVAHNQVLADPTLPFYAKFASALQTLGAGLGAVNAIKSVSTSGGGATASAGAGAGGLSQVGGGAVPRTSSRRVHEIEFRSSNDLEQALLNLLRPSLIGALNDAHEDGGDIRFV